MLERIVLVFAGIGIALGVVTIADLVADSMHRRAVLRELIDARYAAEEALDQCRDELGRKWEESYRLEERECSADGACKYTVLVPIAAE